MKILMTGGTGLIGNAFIKQFRHYQFTVLSRQPQPAGAYPHVNTIHDLKQLKSINDFDAVINLAGEPIADKRWTASQKQRIVTSRLTITEQLATLINASSTPPRCFISGSAIGYYGRQFNGPIDEINHQTYDEFSHRPCLQWEAAALACQTHTRVAILRTGIVLAPQGGALAKMLPAFKFFAGGPMANGKQVMSWISLDDMVNAINFLLNDESAVGAYNLTAPQPVTNLAFSQTLAQTLNRPCWLPLPAWLLRILFGEMADLLVYGQNVYPRRLLEAGFKFQHPELSLALTALLQRAPN